MQGDIDRWFSEVCCGADVQKVELVILSCLGWDTHTATSLDFASLLCGLVPDAEAAAVILAETHIYAALAAAGVWLFSTVCVCACVRARVGVCVSVE